MPEKLRGPHLLLADVRHDDRAALRGGIDGLDDLLGHDDALVHRLVGHGALLPPPVDAVEPFRVLRRLDAGIDRCEHVLDVRDNAEVRGHVLAYRTRIAVDVDDLGVLRIGGELAGDAVRKAHAEGDDEVRLVDGVVRRRRTVHAGEPERERIALVEGAEPH